MSAEDSISKINKRAARSGKVSYASPVVLYDTARSRIVFVPFFIRHSDREELASKIVSYRKSFPPQLDEVEEKSLSLNGEATDKLLRALGQHLAVARESKNGDYIAIPVAGGSADLTDYRPEEVAQALSRALAQPGIVEHLSGTELSSELMRALRGAIRLTEMRNAVATLRHMLDTGECAEDAYQQWCQQHSWAFGNAYVMRDEVREISTGDTLDILLPRVISGYRDFVELKRPDADVLLWDRDHRNWYFSAPVSRAIGQCHRYIDMLYEFAKEGLLDHPEVVAYYPRAIIVIGRSAGWAADKLKALHGLNYRLYGVVVMTYEQLLAQGERLVKILGSDEDPDNVIAHDSESLETIDEYTWEPNDGDT